MEINPIDNAFRWDVSTKPRIPYGTMHLTLLAIVTFLVGGYFLFEYYDIRLILVKVGPFI